jgi:excisionase family DNA binding protein
LFAAYLDFYPNSEAIQIDEEFNPAYPTSVAHRTLNHPFPAYRIVGHEHLLLDFRRFESILNFQSRAMLMTTEPWVTAEQVAHHLGVVKDTVYRWREKKGLPAHQIGRLWKFKLSEVDEWVRVGGAAEEGVASNPRKAKG